MSMPTEDALWEALEHAGAAYTGTPIEVPLPPGLAVEELHSAVTLYRELGWHAEVSPGGTSLVLS